MEQIPPVLINNKKVNDAQKIADAFNTFFLKITENLDLRQEARGDAISFLKNAFPRKFPDFKIIPTTETEIFISFLYCIQVDPIMGCETSSQTLDIECVKYNKS
jgi:hypothetical protein